MDQKKIMKCYHFNNKRVWITGASGLALAKKLLSVGAKVVVTAHNVSQLEAEFYDNQHAIIIAGDITSQSNNYMIVNEIKRIWDGIDCVILNAGSAEHVDIKNFHCQPFENMIETNFLSLVRGINATLPILRQSDTPHLIGMSSSVAWQGLPQGYAYSASKAAIRNLFQDLKIELAAENIDVSWVCPGFAKTPLTNKNNFTMPVQIIVEKSAQIIYQKLCKKTTEINFPKYFIWFLKLISFLPADWSAKFFKKTVPA